MSEFEPNSFEDPIDSIHGELVEPGPFDEPYERDVAESERETETEPTVDSVEPTQPEDPGKVTDEEMQTGAMHDKLVALVSKDRGGVEEEIRVNTMYESTNLGYFNPENIRINALTGEPAFDDIRNFYTGKKSEEEIQALEARDREIDQKLRDNPNTLIQINERPITVNGVEGWQIGYAIRDSEGRISYPDVDIIPIEEPKEELDEDEPAPKSVDAEGISEAESEAEENEETLIDQSLQEALRQLFEVSIEETIAKVTSDSIADTRSVELGDSIVPASPTERPIIPEIISGNETQKDIVAAVTEIYTIDAQTTPAITMKILAEEISFSPGRILFEMNERIIRDSTTTEPSAKPKKTESDARVSEPGQAVNIPEVVLAREPAELEGTENSVLSEIQKSEVNVGSRVSPTQETKSDIPEPRMIEIAAMDTRIIDTPRAISEAPESQSKLAAQEKKSKLIENIPVSHAKKTNQIKKPIEVGKDMEIKQKKERVNISAEKESLVEEKVILLQVREKPVATGLLKKPIIAQEIFRDLETSIAKDKIESQNQETVTKSVEVSSIQVIGASEELSRRRLGLGAGSSQSESANDNIPQSSGLSPVRISENGITLSMAA